MKAFSEDAVEMNKGFGKLEKTMKLMFVDKLFLWPRFEERVADTLKQNAPELIDTPVSLSRNMNAIHDAILSIIRISLDEIKEKNKNVCFTQKYTSIYEGNKKKQQHTRLLTILSLYCCRLM